jgi:hypothetical protein
MKNLEGVEVNGEILEHLRKFLEVKFEGGLEMFLAFWDPVILATLVGHKENKTLYVPKCQKHFESTFKFHF